MDGIAFLTRLRHHRGVDTNPPPVIAVTSYPYTFSPRVAEAGGFRGFLVKPVTPMRLAEEVRKVFDDTKSSGGA
jgi:CheY-like chemotaxis protein